MSLYGSKLSLARSSLYAIGGSGGAQLMLIVAAPILTRLFTPEEFGIFAIYVAIVTFLSMGIFLKYELAIPISQSITSTLSILKLCLGLGALIGFLILVALYFFETEFRSLIPSSAHAIPLWILPVAAINLAFLNLWRFWLVKAGRFDIIAISRGSVSFILLFVQLTGGLLKLGSIALIAGHVIANLVTVLALIATVFRKYFYLLYRITFGSVKKAIVRYANFPRYIVLSDGLLVIGSQAPPVVIAGVYSLAEAGLFALALRVCLAPVAMIAESCGKVFMSRALILKTAQTLPSFVFSSYSLLIRIAIIPFTAVAFFASDLAAGESWKISGVYISLLVPSIVAIFVFVPLMTLFLVLEKQKMELRFQFLIMLMRMIGLLVGVFLGEIYWAIAMYSLFTSVGYVIAGYWIMSKSGVWMTNILVISFFELIISAIILGPAVWLIFYLNLHNEIISSWYYVLLGVTCMLTILLYSCRLKSSFKKLKDIDLGVS